MKQVISDMSDVAWRLIESSKTPTGKMSMTSESINNRSLAFKILDWVVELRKIVVAE